MAGLPAHASFTDLIETITIIGGGLTGLSLAVALRKNGIPVHLHEAGTYPRHRVCGEFISGVTTRTLETLGIAESLSDAAKHTSVTWFSGNNLLRESTLPSPALAISRYLLDDRLQQLARETGVVLETNSRKSSEPDQPGIVKASGRIPTRGKWIGLKAHVRDISTTAHLEMHSGPTGYLGITPVEDGWHNVCGLFHIDRTIKAKQEALLPAYLRENQNLALAARIESAEWRPESFSAVAGFDLGNQPATPGVFSLGDSHAIIPPFTGNGMTMAFQSAEIALPHLIAYANQKIDWPSARERTEKQLRRHFRKRMTASKLIHPLLFEDAARHILKHAPLSPILHLIR